MAETIYIFTNPSNDSEWIMLPESRTIDGYKFQDYINMGIKASTPDTCAPSIPNRDIQSKHLED